jgi:hypothetical protein
LAILNGHAGFLAAAALENAIAAITARDAEAVRV